MQFEWDPAKEKRNIVKHRLSFSEACLVFTDPYQLNLYDEEHSDVEERWIIIGEIPVRKIVVVIHTSPNNNERLSARIISARKATKTEREVYFARRSR